MAVQIPPTSSSEQQQASVPTKRFESNERSQRVQGVKSGLDTLGAGVEQLFDSLNTEAKAFAYEMQSQAAKTDAKTALFMGQQKENVVRREAARFRGTQLTAQSASGFVAGEGSNLDQINATQYEFARTIENVRLSTADAVNKLDFEAEVAQINSDLNKKISKIQHQTGVANMVIGLAVAGYSAYGSSQSGGGKGK